VEHAPQGKRGLFGSFVALGLPAGIILSNLVFLMTSALASPEQFAAWAWRVPFLASGVLVAVGFFVRLTVAESPIFEGVQRARSTRRMPVVDVLRSEGRAVFLAAGSYLSISATGYLVIVYFVSYATSNLGFSLPVTLGLLQSAAVLLRFRFCSLPVDDLCGWALANLVALCVRFEGDCSHGIVMS
jgi:MFS family permease